MTMNRAAQTTIDAGSVTIADNASLSDALFLGGYLLKAVVIPATWVTATVITFSVSQDGTTYYDLYKDVNGTLTEVSVPVAASRFIVMDPTLFWGIQYLKIRSGTSGSPVNQTEDAGVVVPVIAYPM